MSKVFQKLVILSLLIGNSEQSIRASDQDPANILIAVSAASAAGVTVGVGLCITTTPCGPNLISSINDALNSVKVQIGEFGNSILVNQIVKNAATKGITLDANQLNTVFNQIDQKFNAIGGSSASAEDIQQVMADVLAENDVSIETFKAAMENIPSMLQSDYLTDLVNGLATKLESATSGSYTPPSMGNNSTNGSNTTVTPEDLQELASEASTQQFLKLQTMKLDNGNIDVTAVQEEYTELVSILKNTDMSAEEMAETKAEFDTTETFMKDNDIEIPDVA